MYLIALEIPELSQTLPLIHVLTAWPTVSNVSMQPLVKLVLQLDSSELLMDLLALHAMLCARPVTTLTHVLPANRLPL